ncbi:MAG TPA: DNRLRE domain-containing protein [bacterium]|nr:DNRLRE domain-containing protein [bacterium]HPN43393.1 DNRLRE domain-containing protein [bacterium]
MKSAKFSWLMGFVLITILALFVACEFKTPVETPAVQKIESNSAPETFVFTKGTTIYKAELWISVFAPPVDGLCGKQVGVFKVLKAWNESTTWNQFYSTSPQYNTTALATFTPTAVGYQTIDVTGLVQSWINGDTNFGVLLKQVVPYNISSRTNRELYESTENVANHPFLRIYTTASSYVQEEALLDTEILQWRPDYSYGNLNELATGFQNVNGTIFEKQSLLIFDFTLEEGDGGCTLTPGYWKTHSQQGPAPYDDTWQLLGPLQEKEIFFLSNQTYLDVLNTSPKGNVYYILAHAYIAAQLNFLNGANPTAAQSAFTAATALFKSYTPAAAAALKGAAKTQWTNLATLLDNYNNGYTGPGHCE